MRRLAVALMIAALGGCAETTPAPAAPAVVTQQKAARSETDVLASALPGVVLIVNTRPDGSIVYGAGILLDDHGRVLTNMHVVANAKSLGVLLHDSKRNTYIPQEGGLARYLFENEKAIQPAALQRGNPQLDLAVIRVDADTSKYPRLSIRDEPVRIGERVMALGHPSETVWSFSAGLISATPNGILQTDAAINHGNSGGPLIDAQGRIVGVNTSKLFGDTQGIAFARPIALAKELVDGTQGALAMDFSTPERAFESCKRAFELGSASYAECLDEDSALRARRESESRQRAAFPELASVTVPFDPQVYIATQRKLLAASARGGTLEERMRESVKVLAESSGLKVSEVNRLTVGMSEAEIKARRLEMQPYFAQVDKERFERTGMKLDGMNIDSMREVRRMGIRIERLAVMGDRAWLKIAGRNLDATPYAYSELWHRKDGAWRPQSTVFADDLATLPEGFPKPLYEYEVESARSIERFKQMAKDGFGRPPTNPSPAPAAAAAPAPKPVKVSKRPKPRS